MKKFLIIILSTAGLLAASSCNSNPVVKAGEPPKIVKTSAAKEPDWILKKKNGSDFVYFVGISMKAADLKTAKKESINDATSQLVDYIGFRATTKFQSRKEFSEFDNISSFKQDIVQTIEGKGSASVSVDVEDIYYEQYPDGKINLYSLIKFPQAWIEKERKRLQKLTADQREESSRYITEANASVKAGELVKALDLSVSALSISEKAAENSDIYDESKNIILLILSGINFSLDSSSKYAYIEGGSDPIQVKVSSSKTGGGVSGMPVIAVEDGSNANVNSQTGNISDDKGLIYYFIDGITKPETDKISLTISFSLNKFDSVRKIDEDFYKQAVNLQKTQALHFNMAVAKHDKVIPTGIAIFETHSDENKKNKIEYVHGFQDSLSGKFTSGGYNIIMCELPDLSAIQGVNAEQVKSIVSTKIRNNYPQVKRLILGMREINVLGRLGKDISLKSYNLDSSDLVIVDMKLVLSMLDIESEKVLKETTVEAKGQGLNVSQAIGTAEKRVIEKLNTEMNNNRQ